MSAEDLSESVDVAFVGWMEPGQDFRKFVAKCAKCVITTFDTGGQCGMNSGLNMRNLISKGGMVENAVVDRCKRRDS